MRATRPKRPMVIVAAATGLRPAEWLALEWRDVDLDALGCLRPPLVRQGSVEVPEDRGEPPGVPLQSIALEAIGRQPSGGRAHLSFLPSAAATSTCTTSATGSGNPRRSGRDRALCAGSTISATPSPPLRSVPASPPSTSPAYRAPA
jgi:integrase